MPRIWSALRLRFFFNRPPRRQGHGRHLLCACVTLLSAACTLTGARGQDADARPAAKAASVSNDYKISPADVLEIIVFQEDDLKSTLRVSNEGTIVFPLIGTISVAGMTTQKTARTIQERLAQGFLINPQVSVNVTEFSKRRFTVLGEVQKPGSYDMPDQQDVTLLQAIGMAGGYTRIANPAKVTLMRKNNGKDETIQLNAKSMAHGHAESAFTVLPGDVITVSESLF